MFNDHRHDVTGLGVDTPPYDRCNPLRPVPLVRPLVLRAHRGEHLTVRLRNDIRDRRTSGCTRRVAGSVAPAAPASGTATAPTSGGTRTRPRRSGGP